jgi:glycerate dehydrogenase
MQRIVMLERESLVADRRRPDFAREWVDYPRSTQAEVEARPAGATIAVLNKRLIGAEHVLADPLIANLDAFVRGEPQNRVA